MLTGIFQNVFQFKGVSIQFGRHFQIRIVQQPKRENFLADSATPLADGTTDLSAQAHTETAGF